MRKATNSAFYSKYYQGIWLIFRRYLCTLFDEKCILQPLFGTQIPAVPFNDLSPPLAFSILSRIRLSQRLPFFGILRLSGENNFKDGRRVFFFPRSFFPSYIFALSFCTHFCFGGPHEGGFECACSNRNPLFVSIILAASFFIVTPFLCSATEYRWWIFFFSFFQILPAFCRELVFYSNISIVFLVFFFCNFFCFGILQLARCVSVFYPVL